ncbi:hypothetical protein NMG60_11037096 [Bertholletia excelsa]
MAVRLLSYEVADLCLGKPPLRSLPVSATVAEALSVLKSSDSDSFIGVWSCESHHAAAAAGDCRCLGKICMADVICFLCEEPNLYSPSSALKSPVSVLLPKVSGLVRHIEPSSSLLEAIDLILQGAQNLVVPLKTNSRRKFQKSPSPISHNYCWLTQEDVIRFLLSSIGLFSPIASLPIDALGLISEKFSAVGYHAPPHVAAGAIARSIADQTSVAVVDDENDGVLIGEISPLTLACCNETAAAAAAAVATLSAGDLMAYIDGGGPPDDLVRLVKARLKERNLEGMLEQFVLSSELPASLSPSASSSDEESSTPTTPFQRTGRYGRSSSYSARLVRRSEAIVCHPGSSLVAVMIQAIAHRVNYVWVVEDDCSLAGIVTFTGMLKVFREHLQSME